LVDVECEERGRAWGYIPRGQRGDAVLVPGQSIKVRVLEWFPTTMMLTVDAPADAASVAAVSGEFLDGIVVAVNKTSISVKTTLLPGEDPVVGTVHISQIKFGVVNNLSEEFEVGSKVRVRVVRSDGTRLRLSLKPPFRDLKLEVSARQFEGVVQRVVDFGLFVTLVPRAGLPSVSGLLHVSEMRDDFSPGDISQIYRAGDKVRVRIIRVDDSKETVWLSMSGVEQVGGIRRRSSAEEGGSKTG